MLFCCVFVCSVEGGGIQIVSSQQETQQKSNAKNVNVTESIMKTNSESISWIERINRRALQSGPWPLSCALSFGVASKTSPSAQSKAHPVRHGHQPSLGVELDFISHSHSPFDPVHRQNRTTAGRAPRS